MSIYDKTKMLCRTWIESVNNLFKMGKELEEKVDNLDGKIIEDVELTEVNNVYTLTITYKDGTTDVMHWDKVAIGIDNITMSYNDGVYTITFHMSDGTTKSFALAVGNLVTEEELAIIDAQNVKLTGAQTIAGQKTLSESPIVPTSPTTPTGAVNSVYVNDASDGVNNIVHKSGNERIDGVKTFGQRSIITSTSTGSNEIYIDLKNIDTINANWNANFYAGVIMRDVNNLAIGRIEASPRNNLDMWLYLTAYNQIGNEESRYNMVIRKSATDITQDYVWLDRTRAFNPNNIHDVVTIESLIQALRYYNLIQ